MSYAAYVPATGRIEQVMSGPLADCQALAGARGLALAPVEPGVSDATHRVVAGAAVALPPQPDRFHRWSWQEQAWMDPRTPEQALAEAWAAVRAKRGTLLAASDWVVLRAADRSEPVPASWRAYRQALRDVTMQPDPAAIHWPEVPNGV
jgi:hypothetical protein